MRLHIRADAGDWNVASAIVAARMAVIALAAAPETRRSLLRLLVLAGAFMTVSPVDLSGAVRAPAP